MSSPALQEALARWAEEQGQKPAPAPAAEEEELALLEGLRFLGFEREAEYAEIARARIAHWAKESE